LIIFIKIITTLSILGYNIPYYLVERYDRTINNDGQVCRIHQEDFCQALGIAPELKYEREGGPSLKTCQTLITKYALRPAVDHIRFINIIIFNYLIGNADAHGKNFSFLYRENKPDLAPAYDLLSTEIYPDLSKKMAMKIGSTYKPRDVYRHDFYKLVPDTKASKSGIDKQIDIMVGKIVAGAENLKKDLEAHLYTSDVFEKIIGVIKERTLRLK
jgi:serine/threonine-protein kinase HipA